jgi:hypothetical protein
MTITAPSHRQAAQPQLELVLRSDPRSRQEFFALTGTVT